LYFLITEKNLTNKPKVTRAKAKKKPKITKPVVRLKRLNVSEIHNNSSSSNGVAGTQDASEESKKENDIVQPLIDSELQELPPSSPEVYDDDKDSDYELDPKHEVKFSLINESQSQERSRRKRRTRTTAAALYVIEQM